MQIQSRGERERHRESEKNEFENEKRLEKPIYKRYQLQKDPKKFTKLVSLLNEKFLTNENGRGKYNRFVVMVEKYKLSGSCDFEP